jgi:hypothetical protein
MKVFIENKCLAQIEGKNNLKSIFFDFKFFGMIAGKASKKNIIQKK